MYLRRTTRRRKDGSEVGYLQLAHNEWDAKAGHSVVRVLYSFGREDQLDRQAIVRLIGSLQRVLEPDQALAAAAGDGLRFLESRPIGGAWALEGLWRILAIDRTLSGLLEGRRLDARAERVIFAMVANRALEPLSKLAASKWVSERAWIDGLSELDEDACYRAMDWLLEVEEELAEAVYFATADLLNLEVDLLFFDTTSTYFERETPDAEVLDEEGEVIAPAFRAHGKSKDHRPDLPQVVIGMAVTRTGIPIRVWCWPGNTSDQQLIRQAKNDLRAWKLARVVWVADRGFQSAENRRYLQRAGGHYILGEKLRGNSKEAAAALSRQGRYHTVAGNLRVKEVILDDATMRDRFVVCHNPEEAKRDKQIRDRLLAQLTDAIDGSDQLPAPERAELAGSLHAKRGLKRFLRTTKGGLLRVDRSAVAAEAHLDGKFLLRSSDPTLTTEDIALGYKQLLEIERGWRDMKTTLDLRPVRHRKEDRIRAHVILCWLALLLIRIAESHAHDTWRNLRDELQRIHLGTFTGPAGTSQQRTELTTPQREILRALNVPEPPLFLALGTAHHATQQQPA
ncbi:MAG: IS1634 family transposase [Actinobacteria bacterium]|nr:IS1634 family transposase [Actinomycetota bacterium]MCA1699966.1 IS1634 family transposase [Actinomycetota bacterium]